MMLSNLGYYITRDNVRNNFRDNTLEFPCPVFIRLYYLPAYLEDLQSTLRV